MNGTLSIPKVETLGNTYLVTWAEEGISMRFERLYQHRDYHIDAEITVTDRSELNPHLLGPVRSSITKSPRNMIHDLEEVSEREDWRTRLRQAGILVLGKYREGAPVVGLGSMEEPDVTRPVFEGLIWEGQPSVLYGPGGIGKSIVALNVMSAIHTGTSILDRSTTQSNVLVLDWETSDKQTFWRNREILTAQGAEPGPWPDPEFPKSERTGMVFYRFQNAPLVDDCEFLKGQIAEKNIGTVLIDSAGPACGGQPESADSVLSFFSALRNLSDFDRPLNSLIICHVSHATKQGITKGSPFGSVYWSNLPRQVFELQNSQTQGATYSDYAVYHRKSNLGPLKAPLAFRLTWGQGCSIEPIDLKDNARLRQGMDLDDRVEFLIDEQGAMNPSDIAARVDAPEKMITNMLETDFRYENQNGKWQFSESKW